MAGENGLQDESTSLLPSNSSRRRARRASRGSLGDDDDVEAGRRNWLSLRVFKLKSARAAKPSGQRPTINDYPAIDGLHDLTKDSRRVRSLYSRRGLAARAAQAWDAASGWVAVALMGTLTACVAYSVDVSVVTVSSWKQGYCRTGWWKAKQDCCTGDVPTSNAALSFSPSLQAPRGGEGGVMIMGGDRLGGVCADWHFWSNDYVSSYAIYVGFALAFGTFSGLVTLLTKKSLPSAQPSFEQQISLASSNHVDHGEMNGGADGYRSEILGNGNAPNGQHKKENDNKKDKAGGGKVIYRAAGSGIPEIKTIISGFYIPNYLDLDVLVAKAVGSVFAVSTGMCLGKEGPFVHISTCVAYLVGNLLPKYRLNGRQLREALSAGCAAGLCVAFGAPIGGVLFSLEEISTLFPRKVLLRAFLCSLFAAAVLKYLNPTGTGKLVLFETNYGTDYAPRHYLIFVLLGVAGGIFGGIFCRLNFMWSKWFRSFAIIKNYPVFEVFLITLATAVSQFPNVVTREPGDVIIENLLIDCRREGTENAWVCLHEHGSVGSRTAYFGWLIYGMLVKLFLTTITFGVKVPSGIIIPALNAGAFFGRLVGQFSVVTVTLQPGIFAMVGAVAFLAGVCRMTISLAVILFELTGEVDYVIPDMIGILVAKWVADAIEPEGVYDLAQTLLGHPFLDDNVALRITQRQGALVTDLLPPAQDLAEITLDVPASGLLERRLIQDRLDALKRKGLVDPGLVLLAQSGALVGYLTEAEFETGLKQADEATAVDDAYSGARSALVRVMGEPDPGAADDEVDLTLAVDSTPLTVTRDTPVEYAVQMFSKLGLAYLCVVEEGPGRFCGLIMKKNLLDWVNERKNE